MSDPYGLSRGDWLTDFKLRSYMELAVRDARALVKVIGVTMDPPPEPPDVFYARFGLVRAPWEGRFAFRLRAEISLGVGMTDCNWLRERLYRMWRARR